MFVQKITTCTICSLFAILVFAPDALGQGLFGSLTGNVIDPTGAPIPNATVKLANADTGVANTASTNNSGIYVFSDLQPGNYSATITSPAFSTLTQNGILITANTVTRSDAQL
ncbi:MAG TPA: carboxypeptidase-like regulatory domain-containing protein, partial [Bryobacteraceae bacterium]|nr:carboxypeptidase-like regulatory domain-containing protein [Bryobacteraceae bacterium]